LVLLILACLAGCGDDEALTYSHPVSINFKVKSDDTTNDTVVARKNITTESGNPFAKFISESRLALGGGDPSRIVLSSAELLLGASTSSTTGLEQVFSGEVVLLFHLGTTNNSFIAGTIVDPTGSGPAQLTVTFDSNEMGPDDYARFLAADFQVVLRGPAAATFAAKGAQADLQVTLRFKSFK